MRHRSKDGDLNNGNDLCISNGFIYEGRTFYHENCTTNQYMKVRRANPYWAEVENGNRTLERYHFRTEIEAEQFAYGHRVGSNDMNRVNRTGVSR
jgi:hypothetical protein